MPDGPADPSHWRNVALDALGRHLRDDRDAHPLEAGDLDRYPNRGLTHGWRLPPRNGQGPAVRLDVLVDGGFPYTPVRVAIGEGPGPLDWPHIERDGVLCVLPGEATISPRDPVGVAADILTEAQGLIEKCKVGAIDDDFRDEFLSYWALAADEGAPPFTSLVAPNGPSRQLVIWRGDKVRVCADDRATLEQWLTWWGVEKPKKGYTFQQGVLLRLPQPLVPSEYPRTAADLDGLARNLGSDAAALLEERAAADVPKFEVLIGAPTAHGACFAGLLVSRPKDGEMHQGFRPGRVPRGVHVRRYLSAGNRVVRCTVGRADHDWIHGRDQDPRQARLKQARVMVLGCGAIGAGGARLLAQSGVGHLTLVDHQLLDWPNISRHALGARSALEPKAAALAETLRRDFPHLGEIEGRVFTFGLGATGLMDELRTFDVIIGATGEWSADALLNEVQQSREGVPPIVYAWMEPHAAAGHTVLVRRTGDGGCLHCGFDDRGRPTRTVTEWPEGEDLRQEPACGAVFTPYGAVELTWTQALVAELVVDVLLDRANGSAHRIWVGRRELVEAQGGKWSASWCETACDPGNGGFTLRQVWPASPSCPICKKAEAA